MKKALLLCLLAASSLLTPACSSKGGDPAPAPTPAPVSQFAPVSGTFTITPTQGAKYTVTKLSLKTEARELAASKELYTNHIFRGVSPDGKYVQVDIYITQPMPLSGSGPWKQQTTVYTSTSTYAQLSLVGNSYGTISGASSVYTASFTGAIVSGTLTQ